MDRTLLFGNTEKKGRKNKKSVWYKYPVSSGSPSLAYLPFCVYACLSFFCFFFSKFEKNIQANLLSCFSAKIEERFDHVPGVEVLNTFIPPPVKPGLPSFYHKSEFLQMELAVLSFFSWNVIKPTTAHFVPYYRSSCVAPGDLCDGIPVHSTEALALCVDSYADYFKDISLQCKILLCSYNVLGATQEEHFNEIEDYCMLALCRLRWI